MMIMKMVMMMVNVQNIHISSSRSTLHLSHPSLSPERLASVTVSQAHLHLGSCWVHRIGNISMGK